MPHETTERTAGDIRALLEQIDFYRALALAFLPHRAADDPALRAAFRRLPGPLGERLQALLERQPLEERQAEERRLFAPTLTREAPPYETEYGDALIFRKAQDLADIAGFYRAFGLVPRPESGERLDHVATELEFLGFLRLKEAWAWERGRREDAEVTADAARKFLHDHAGRWMPGFLDRLAARARHDGFYAGLAEGAKEFLREELRAAGVEPDDLPALEPRQEADAPEGCSFSCGAGPGMEEER